MSEKIMNRSIQQKSTHDKMVQLCTNWLSQNGHSNIKSDLTNNQNIPEKITWVSTNQGHIPDVTTDSMLLEVETADSIGDMHTADQWALFSAHAAQTGKEFWVVVPLGNRFSAQDRLKALGLTAKIWEV